MAQLIFSMLTICKILHQRKKIELKASFACEIIIKGKVKIYAHKHVLLQHIYHQSTCEDVCS